MIDLKRILNAVAKEYIRKNGNRKLGVGESIAAVSNDGVFTFRNTVHGTDISIILGEPYRIDRPYDVKTAEEAALAEFEKEFGGRTLENEDEFTTLLSDATLIIRMRNNISETEVIKGKALEIDMAIIEED